MLTIKWPKWGQLTTKLTNRIANVAILSPLIIYLFNLPSPHLFPIPFAPLPAQMKFNPSLSFPYLTPHPSPHFASLSCTHSCLLNTTLLDLTSPLTIHHTTHASLALLPHLPLHILPLTHFSSLSALSSFHYSSLQKMNMHRLLSATKPEKQSFCFNAYAWPYKGEYGLLQMYI